MSTQDELIQDAKTAGYLAGYNYSKVTSDIRIHVLETQITELEAQVKELEKPGGKPEVKHFPGCNCWSHYSKIKSQAPF